jgi:hypothetical protein
VLLALVISADARATTWFPALTLSQPGDTVAAVGISEAGEAAAILQARSGSWLTESAVSLPAEAMDASAEVEVAAKVGTTNGPNVSFAMAPSGEAVLVWAQENRSIHAVTRRSDGNWSAPTIIYEGQFVEAPSVAIDGSGGAITTWESETGSSKGVDAASLEGGVWSAAVVLEASTRSKARQTAAISSTGDGFVAWEEYAAPGWITKVATRVADAWVGTSKVPGGSETGAIPNIAVTGAGEAIVVWREGEQMQASSRPLGGEWTTPTPISVTETITSQAALGVTAAGEVIAVWSGSSGEARHVQAATRSAAGLWQSPTTLDVASGGDLDAPRLAVGANGGGVAAWASSQSELLADNEVRETTHLRAATVAPGGTWSEAVEVVGASSPERVSDAVVAMEDGLGIVAWSAGSSSRTGFAEELRNEPVPTINGERAEGVTNESATLTAKVDPEGDEVQSCFYEYGATPGFGHAVPCASLPGDGHAAMPVSAQISGLSPGTTYYFRAVAGAAGAGRSYGPDETFTTTGGEPPAEVGPPEFGRCLRVALGGGHYAGGTCISSGTRNSYDWFPAFGGARPLEHTHFTTVARAATKPKLETVARQIVTCTGEAGRGEYASNTKVSGVVLTFTGCALGTMGACQSPGSASGEITTNTLVGSLGVIATSSEGAARNKIGLDYKAASGDQVTEFTCAGAHADVSGSLIAEVPHDTMVAAATVKFSQARGVQKPTHFEGGAEAGLSAFWGEDGPFQPTGLGFTDVQTSEEKVEVSSVA